MAAEQTLKQLSNPQLPQNWFCIVYPTDDNDFELKSSLIRLLPAYHGLEGEDPYTFLKEFHVVCSNMKPKGVTDELVKLKAFPFSVKDSAKEWLYSLPSATITTWAQMEQLFLQSNKFQ